VRRGLKDWEVQIGVNKMVSLADTGHINTLNLASLADTRQAGFSGTIHYLFGTGRYLFSTINNVVLLTMVKICI